MADLVIKEAELQQLDKLIGNIPTAYGVGIVNYLNYLVQLRQQEAQADVPKEEAPKTLTAVTGKKKS